MNPGEETGAADRLPRGRMPHVGTDELTAALHRRREGRRLAVAELRAALGHLAAAIESRRARIAGLQEALAAAPERRDAR